MGLARARTVLMRQHMAGLLQAEGFVQCPEQQRPAELPRETAVRHGAQDLDHDYPLLRSQSMGAVYAMVLSNVPLPLTTLRAELFARYRLDRELGVPPDAEAPGGGCGADLPRFFATGPPGDQSK